MKTNRRHAPVVRPSVVFSPNLADGINAMADAVKPTIGPLPRLVGVERMNRSRMPEILDDAGVIARRIIQIEDQTADVGAMMLRHGMWRMHERMGDGAATTAVLAQAIMQHAVRGVAAGMHPMWLRRGIETGVATVAGELRRLARPLPPGKAGRALLASLAHSLSADSELMDALVQVVNQIGSEGAVEVVVNERRTIDREFIEGAMWNMGWVSPAFLTDRLKGIARQEDVSVILFDGKIETGRQAADSIRRWSELGIQSVALVVNDVAEEALQVYIQAHLQKLLGLILIKLPIVGDEKLTALQDISALTGARILFDIGELMALQQEDAGFARRMWSTAIKFGIIAGARNGEMLRARADAVRTAIANFNDKKEWEQLRKLRWRLAQLTGGIAVLQIGAVTRSAADTRKEHAERLIMVLQGAANAGVVPGGGAALLACQDAVQRMVDCGEGKASLVDDGLSHRGGSSDDLRFGIECVAQALQAPLATIVANAGFEPSPVLAQVKSAGVGYGFDVCAAKVVNMFDAGIVDSLPIVERALQTAASVAAMAVTTTCVVHRRKHYQGRVTP